MEGRRNNLVFIDDTRFIFRTNFSGEPDPKFGNRQRNGNILIPEELADELADEGYDVRVTKPREGEEEGFIPRYFVKAILNYREDVDEREQPKVYLVEEGHDPELLDEETVGIIDNIYVLNVKATLAKTYLKKYDRKVLYIRVMYVEHDMQDDPWGETYRREGQPEEE